MAAAAWIRAWAVERRWALAHIAVFGLAAAIRARYVLPAGFPLNDGGLFFTMSRDIQAAGYALPQTTSYNGELIPFAYPPLALYLAAIFEALTPLSMLDVYWLLPLVGSMLVVAGVYALARTCFSGRAIALLAVAAFALAPRSFSWLLMGGGVTRSFGLAAALFAIASYRSALRTGRPRDVALSAVLSAVTVLTHPEATLLLAGALALCSLERIGWRTARIGAVVGAGAALLSSPWWATVVLRHGLEPFSAAEDAGGALMAQGLTWAVWWQTLDPVVTGEPFFALIGAAGILGAVVALAQGHWWLPAWWLVIVASQVPAYPTFAVVPTAILAAYGMRSVVGPMLFEVWLRSGRLARLRVAALAGGLAAFAIYGAGLGAGEPSVLAPLSDADLRAMAWAQSQTPEDARFLVIPVRPWQADREGEWFPVLAKRRSIGTPQGSEWRDEDFRTRVSIHRLAWSCSASVSTCLDWLRITTGFTHVYVPANCCWALRSSLRDDPHYRMLHDGAAAIAVVDRLAPARVRSGGGAQRPVD